MQKIFKKSKIKHSRDVNKRANTKTQGAVINRPSKSSLYKQNGKTMTYDELF